MLKLIICAWLIAACSAPDPYSSEQSRSTRGEPSLTRAALLQGAGSCIAHTCTMHFAELTTGDAATFTSARCEDGACPARRGRLTASAQAKAREMGKQLASMKLEESYGCPGCADGPVYVAVVHRGDGSESRHSFDPLDSEALPPALRDAGALMESVSGALGGCAGNEDVEVDAGCAEVQDDGRSSARP